MVLTVESDCLASAVNIISRDVQRARHPARIVSPILLRDAGRAL